MPHDIAPDPPVAQAPPPPDASELQNLAQTYRELPCLPQVVAEVLEQLCSPDWTIAGIEATIARDQALVARMISVSNSALYGGDHEFRSLNQALVRLGFRAIRSLAVVAAARALFPLEHPVLGSWGQKLWGHAAACGWSARMVAAAVEMKDPDDAFAAGALHDVGKVVVLLNRTEDFERIANRVLAGDDDSVTVERAVLGVDHAQLANWLTASWHLPESIIAAVVHHHDPETAGTYEQLARVVACGDLLAHLHGGPENGAVPIPRLRTRLYEMLGRMGISPLAAEDLTEQVRVNLVNMGDLG